MLATPPFGVGARWSPPSLSVGPVITSAGVTASDQAAMCAGGLRPPRGRAYHSGSGAGHGRARRCATGESLAGTKRRRNRAPRWGIGRHAGTLLAVESVILDLDQCPAMPVD